MSTIPNAFTAKKQKILDALKVPSAEYSDHSPKGSVDDAIKELIDEINQLEGIVTTSSCAGRISVFLEGRKVQNPSHPDGREERLESSSPGSTAPGGKGNGGHWLFVSHDPLILPTATQPEDGFLSKTFALNNVPGILPASEPSETRYIRFQFEPMILHIMTASLKHAQVVLAAAVSAGFRESGVQSLKNLNDPNAFPMVAVRTYGLGFASLVGFLNEEHGRSICQSLVSEAYLNILVKTANERFIANSDRIKRLREQLLDRRGDEKGCWEDKVTRSARKRAEGLERRAKWRKESDGTPAEEVLSTGLSFGGDP